MPVAMQHSAPFSSHSLDPTNVAAQTTLEFNVHFQLPMYFHQPQENTGCFGMMIDVPSSSNGSMAELVLISVRHALARLREHFHDKITLQVALGK